MRKLINTGLALAAATSIMSACTILPSQPDLDVYTLDSTVSIQTAPVPAPYILRINDPYANKYISGPRIVVRTQQGDLNVYAGAKWNDDAPNVFRDSLSQAIRRAGLFKAVTSGYGNANNVDMGIYLNSFQVEYEDNTPVVVIDVDINLTGSKGQGEVVSKHFESRQASQGKELKDVLQAFAQANGKLQADILNWLAAAAHNPKVQPH
ncbi:ABC-type transport auxiliary lipoprotein family protein [Brackiella oedipodis]|uniref:ABC-type transport auxiliary lipoprotein family protein n=1 Tax=Brackiella oedipodis TaxID=124225 RepID=UPI00048F225B|nr:ABC-type transport auxiliary lipoprotein family protein [Brackiella oedipodis]